MTRLRSILWGYACVAAFAAGCSDTVTATDAASPTDARDVTDARDALDVTDARDALDVTDARDALDVTDAPSSLLAPLPSDCTVVFENAADLCATTPCAATASASLRCPGQGFGLSIAASATSPRVAYTDNQGAFHPTLVSLDLAARAGSAERVPTDNWPAKVFSTSDGGFYAAAYSADASTADAMAVYGREPGGWRRTLLEGGRYVAVSFGNNVHRADGRESFVYARGDSTGDHVLATRGADGVWGRETLATGTLFGRFAVAAVDHAGTEGVQLAHWLQGVPDAMSRTLALREGALAPRAVYVQTPGSGENNNHVAAASRSGASSPVVAVGLDDGVHVLIPGATSYAHTLIAGTARGADPTCPGSPSAGGGGGGPPVMCGSTRTCTARGTAGATGSHELARTADGRVWLVYTQLHLDRDYEITYPRPMGPGCPPAVRVVADRSRTDLVVVEVGATLTERARLGLRDGADTAELAVDATGSSLQIARLANEEASRAPLMRFVAVDTASLR